MELSTDQQRALELYKEGKNIFITGPGGVGKSYIIREIVADAQSRGVNVAVCAMTGRAAVLLECGARTLHSWAGFGLAKGTTETIIKKLSRKGRKNWKEVELLLVDEVSMMSHHMFNLLNTIARTLRYDVTFGGIQVIFSGDFYQLPPIPDYANPESGEYCFESEHWRQVFPLEQQLNFTRNFRQNDPTFVAMLNRIRQGDWTREDIEFLQSLVNKEQDPNDEFLPTFMSPTKQEAETMNYQELEALTTPKHVYKVEIRLPKVLPKNITMAQARKEADKILKSLPIERELTLKEGANVMCTANLGVEFGICNGSQGKITHFRNGFPVVQFLNGIVKTITPNSWPSDDINGVCINQIPLLLAYGMTLHRCQGATLESVEINAGSDIFADGQLYVGLGRVKSPDRLFLSDFDEASLRVDPKVKKFYRQFL